ncbi:uncharacterized protein N7529_000585 [Penicillium soppii]|uniref:uncharacterized protein n=1 Tax=Penicillium soppii TaxID=69789 RepID=UPI0025489AC2|nr:uncharacterized protein N7529_000585 [Penicillium soppii]KAJ5881913.1 hypothetical protein N7529_000585 [Penicillium soppii]
MKALTDSIQADSIRSSTRAVIFLATPFSGTSFGKIAYWVNPILSVQAWLIGARLTPRHDYVEGGRWEVSNLTHKFVQLGLNQDYSIFVFYETLPTNLLAKYLPQALRWLSKDELLVDKGSAVPPMAENPIPLNRRHTKMHKFLHSEEADYKQVADRVQKCLLKIREGRPLEMMDKELKKYYEADNRLKIERLSGKMLPMDLCYINLTIVEQTTEKIGISKNAGGAKAASLFSLATRVGVETLGDNVQVELQNVFKGRNGRQAPRKILIRGRAGIGKTTLCKKMVYDFIHADLWKKDFDRIFWLPLRKLQWNSKLTDMKNLFCHEYISDDSGKEKEDLAREAWGALKPGYDRTLFVLDGLDEVSDKLHDGQVMIKQLMKLPYVIVTSRPHMSLPTWLGDTEKFDLELETIGFHPDQVERYVSQYFLDSEVTETDTIDPEEILSFLKKHQLMESLMRIPILLDALCWTWKDFNPEDQIPRPQTMTEIYKAIESRLWNKDLANLEKIRWSQRHMTLPDEHRNHIEIETLMLERLALTGMYNNVINFETRHRSKILAGFKLDAANTINETLGKLSFLRSSGFSLKAHSSEENRTYHFLHLTFQEYFAALHLVRQWKANQDVELFNLSSGEKTIISPVEFLGKNKYNPRYDIVWRFVAGLFSSSEKPKELETFFKSLDYEPLDLLGSCHQRLPLSEAHSTLKYRFQTLASEIEFPEQALTGLLEECDDVRAIGYESMKWLGQIPSQFMEHLISILDKESDNAALSLIGLLGRSRNKLSDVVLRSIASRLWSKVDCTAATTLYGPGSAERKFRSRAFHVRNNLYTNASQALRNNNLPVTLWCEIAKGLEKMDKGARKKASFALGAQSVPSQQILLDFVKKLADSSADVRDAGTQFLRHQPLSPEVLSLLEENIKSGNHSTIMATLKALNGQSNLPGRLLPLLTTILEQTKLIKPVFDVLSQISNPLDDLLSGIILKNDIWLKGGDSFDRWCKNSKLSNEALGVLERNLISPATTHGARKLVLQILKAQPKLSDDVLNEIVKHLGHDSNHVREAAVETLSYRPFLSTEIVNEIVARLDGRNLTKRAALEVLKNQPNLEKNDLDRISNCMKSQDAKIKIAAINALSGRRYLFDSLETLRRITTYIDQADAKVEVGVTPGVIAASIRAISVSDQSVLKKRLDSIALRINDDEKEVREAVVHVLIQQSDPTNDHLNLLATRINDEDKNIRWDVIRFLEKQEALDQKTLDTITSQLRDSENVRLAHPVEVHLLVQMFIQRKLLHSNILLHGHAHRFLLPMLMRSFREHLSWYIQNGKSYLERGDQSGMAMSFDEVNVDNIKAEIELVREQHGIPPVAISYP